MCYITKNATDIQYAITYAIIDTRHDATFTKNATDIHTAQNLAISGTYHLTYSLKMLLIFTIIHIITMIDISGIFSDLVDT